MAKRGGRTSLQANIDAAKRLLFSLIDLLETEFEKLGDSTSMTRSLHDQLYREVVEKSQRLDELIRPVRAQGILTDESYNSMFEHAGDLIMRLENDYRIIGGKRRKK